MAKQEPVEMKKWSELESGVLKDVQAAANLFGEFFTSTYRGGCVRPLTSINQLAGIHTAAQKEADLSGGMKAAQIIGNATGEILDIVLLNKLAGGAVAKFARELSPETIGEAALLSHPAAKVVFTSGAAGFVNGAFLTPVAEDEGISRRFGNGIANGAAFAMLGGVRAGYAKTFSDGLAGRVKAGALAGAAGGATESTLESITHGKSPQVRSVTTSMASWALGNVVAGESMRTISQGMGLAQTSLERALTKSDLTPSLKAAGIDITTGRTSEKSPTPYAIVGIKKPTADIFASGVAGQLSMKGMAERANPGVGH